MTLFPRVFLSVVLLSVTVLAQSNPQSESESSPDVRKAAEQGDAAAQNSLGLRFAAGVGVPQDYAEAAKWFRRAAEQGDAAVQFGLGEMFAFGIGVPQDYAEAAKWYRRAAEQGYADAQFGLGGMYFAGEGVPQDYIQAHMFVNLAAANMKGEVREDIAKFRDNLAVLMTPEQIAEAQRLAREWKPSPAK